MSQEKNSPDFESCSEEGNIVIEFVGFLKENRKLWLIPIFSILLLLGILMYLGATGAAPFIYALY